MPSNKDLVSSLQKNGRITSPKVANAMEQIDRALFVPAGEPPYVDHPVPIGYNATISAPHMHAICLELLKDHLQPGMHALDVGAGESRFQSYNYSQLLHCHIRDKSVNSGENRGCKLCEREKVG